MMQANEVQQRVSQIKQTIQKSSQACDSAGESVPADLKKSIQQLDKRSDQASEKLKQSSD